MNYLCQPVWGKGHPKEKDARKFHPFPWDKATEEELHPTVVKISKKDVEVLNKIKAQIK